MRERSILVYTMEVADTAIISNDLVYALLNYEGR